jgi:xylulokinase
MKRYILGIDIGTSNSKGIISDLEGTIVGSASCSHSTSMPDKCLAEHEAIKIWWNDFKKISSELLRSTNLKGNEIAAIGCSGLGPSMVPVDRKGNPLRPAILYGIDTRSKNEIRYLNEVLGSRSIFKTAGQILSTQSVGPKILWYKMKEPEKYKKTFKILTANGFLVYKLTGRYSIDLCTAAFFGPLFNIEKLRWDSIMSERTGISNSLLPEVFHPSEIVGGVTAEAAEETGLAEGTPVIAGAVDTFAEAVGAGAIEDGEVFLAYGTTMTIVVNSKSLKTHIDLWANVHYVPDIYTLIGGMATSGALTEWFKNNFVYTEQELSKKDEEEVYAILSDMAAGIPVGSEGLVVLPYFSGERTPINDELARGIIAGLTLSHTKRHVYRALLEGTAYSVAHHLDIIGTMGITPKRIISAGGGVENKTWTQIVSDVTGLRQICVGKKGFSAPLGDAYMAGFGAGIFKDFSVLREKWVRGTRAIEPDKKSHIKYCEYLRIYRNLYERTKEDIHYLAELPGLTSRQ